MARKVYCGKCRWHQSAGMGDEAQNERCNAIVDYKSNYSARRVANRSRIHPSEHNVDNDCSLYNWNWFGWRGY